MAAPVVKVHLSVPCGSKAAPVTLDRVEINGITGRVPEWLRGSYYVNGPARFTRAGMQYKHWLDGDGMVWENLTIATTAATASRRRLRRRLSHQARGTPPSSSSTVTQEASAEAIAQAGTQTPEVEAASVEAAAPKVTAARIYANERVKPLTGAEYLSASIKAAMGDDDARRAVRAADDSTSTNTGLTLPQHLQSFITDTDRKSVV